LKTIIFSSLYIISPLALTAQIGINTVTPQAGSMLDVSSADKGVLVPRVDITNLNAIAPITGGATESLLVYNTNNTIGKGFYYWDGSVWIAMGGTGGKDWSLEGNSGTNPATNFIGTKDDVDFVIKTNDIERISLRLVIYQWVLQQLVVVEFLME
jgi:hypothetical protein